MFRWCEHDRQILFGGQEIRVFSRAVIEGEEIVGFDYLLVQSGRIILIVHVSCHFNFQRCDVASSEIGIPAVGEQDFEDPIHRHCW
ncbi:hypothetical protein BMS3Bbin04_00937 [bacterium BMS3Bbin04]|nr:hypothetical protein BMS3Bbin04_00937 [bacterium BMS3Bbin04]